MTELAQQIIEKERAERTGYLDLGRCGLTELPNLSDLDWLETLIVSDRWWDWEQCKWMYSQNNGASGKLTFLNATHLPISLLRLILGNNQISNGGFLEKLTNLSSLDLSGNQIRDGGSLKKLTNLSILYLSNSQISDGGFLEKLTNLSILDLSSNQISDGAFLEKLTNLSTFDLSSNQIRDWGSLEKLTNLSTLYLRNNQIRDGGFLEKLTNLNTLDLRGNQISDGGFLEKLTNLSSLDLSSNQIRDWGSLERLINLSKIDLTDNQLSDLRPLYYFIQERGLEVVWKEWYKTNHWEINVEGNPLQTPPVDVVQKGNAAIIEYFRQLEKTGADPLLEAKLILLGDGRAGKTSLANRLLGKAMPQEADRTLGVDIVIGEYGFPVAEGRQFKLHIWDFAGQDKYFCLRH